MSTAPRHFFTYHPRFLHAEVWTVDLTSGRRMARHTTRPIAGLTLAQRRATVTSWLRQFGLELPA